MKGVLVFSRFLVPPTAAAWVIWPFIIFKRKDLLTEERLNHERIHIRQCNETLVVGFYVIYLINWLINIVTMNPALHRAILFEREAYDKQSDEYWLEKRKFWHWTKYINRKIKTG